MDLKFGIFEGFGLVCSTYVDLGCLFRSWQNMRSKVWTFWRGSQKYSNFSFIWWFEWIQRSNCQAWSCSNFVIHLGVRSNINLAQAFRAARPTPAALTSVGVAAINPTTTAPPPQGKMSLGKSIVASHFFQGMIQTGKVCNDDAYFQNINKLYIMMGKLRQLHDLLHYIVCST